MKRNIPMLLAILVLVFSSLACAALNKDPLSLENLRMAYDQDGTEATTTYAPADVFYAVADLKNAPQGTQVKAVWKVVDVPDLEATPEFPEQTLDITEELFSGKIYFQLTNDFDWPAGIYGVEIYLNDKLSQSAEFSVE